MDKIFEAFRGMRAFQKLPAEQRKFVFYSESESYHRYLWPYIHNLVCAKGLQVCYLTSSITDPILETNSSNINSFFIGDGIIRTILFTCLQADVMIMTMPDLGKYGLQRSKYPVHYVFIPHNMLSTHMVFRKNAFDKFDTVFCVGPHQKLELEESEKLYNLPQKHLLEVGYPPLDYSLKKINNINVVPTKTYKVFIAPSWQKDGILETVGVELIELLTEHKMEVYLRPHRHSPMSVIREYEKRFEYTSEFILINDQPDGIDLSTMDILITDWSGASLSFAFTFEKPVLFIETVKKALNPDYTLYTNVPVEISIRNKIGQTIKLEDIASAPNRIRQLINDTPRMKPAIKNERQKHVYNIGNSIEVGAAFLSKIAT